MTISFNCQCGKTYKVSEANAGKRTKCPACGTALVVPKPDPKPDPLVECSPPLLTPALAAEPTRVPTDPTELRSCGAALVVPQPGSPTECSSPLPTPLIAREPARVPTYPNELPSPVDPPQQGTNPYTEVHTGTDIIRFDSLKELRDALLDGKLNRHYRSRSIAPPPLPEGSSDAAQKNHEDAMTQWEQRRVWRSIGEGLAREETVIRLLYDPVGVYADRGFYTATTICAIPLVFVVLIWIWSGGTWEGEPVRGHGLAGAVLGLPGVAQMFLSGIGIAVAIGIAMIPGYPLGSWVGASIAKRRIDSFPQPPEDDYHYTNGEK